MTLYCQYGCQILTAFERDDGNLNVRLSHKHRNQSLLIKQGDVLTFCTKTGVVKKVIQVSAFVPHIKYGGFTRSGHIIVF